MSGIGGLLGATSYKPLSDDELKRLKVDRVRDNLCLSIGKSIYYYQYFVDFIRQEVWGRTSPKCIDKDGTEAFYTLIHNVSDSTLFEMFDKVFPHKLGKIMESIGSIRNQIIHSCYMVSEVGSLSEKPTLLKKSKSDQALKEKLNINADTMMTFVEIIFETLLMIAKSNEQKPAESIKTIQAKISNLKLELKKVKTPNNALAMALLGYKYKI